VRVAESNLDPFQVEQRGRARIWNNLVGARGASTLGKGNGAAPHEWGKNAVRGVRRLS